MNQITQSLLLVFLGLPIICALQLGEDIYSDIQVLPLGNRPPLQEGQNNQSFQALPLDPAVYYGRLQNKNKKSSKKNRRRNQGGTLPGLSGSFSGGGNSKQGGNSNTLKYAFLQPQTPPDGGPKETCRPPSSISAFTFMNFALSAITIAANLVSNANNNNRNNNNNNNDNNDNGNDVNINNNNNAANNNNAIMIPPGKRRKRSGGIRTRISGKYFSKRDSALRSVLRNQHLVLSSLDFTSERDVDILKNLTSRLMKAYETEECLHQTF